MEGCGGGRDNILFCVDNNPKRWNETIKVDCKNGTHHFKVYSPKEILKTDFDKIIIASLSGYEAIPMQLQSEYGIAREKIDNSYCRIVVLSRLIFLESFAKECKIKNLEGNVAELGVFQGEFAKKINEFFPNKTLYLFDTFEGFDERDLIKEDKETQKLGTHLTNTSVQLVIDKMPHPSNVVIKKGWFPESAVGLDNEKFCFVNIDTDLYDSILSGLEYFYPKMVRGGIILIHDYYSLGYIGVRQAVSEFCEKYNLNSFPIGDDISIAIQKV